MKHMKKIIAGIFLLVVTQTTQAQTVEDIIAKYETAEGGREKLQGIQNMEVVSSLKMGVMGNTLDIPVTMVREKGKLYRKQIGGIMGMGESYTMITDTAGFVFVPAMRGFGRRGGDEGGFGGPGEEGSKSSIIKISPEDLASQQYELDCDGPFAALVNYTAKGHTAQLMGTSKVSKVPCYKIKLTLKSGQTVLYYIDTETYLVKEMEATGEMAINLTGFGSMMKAFGRNPDKNTKATLLVKEYQEFNGIKYPVKAVLSLGPVESDVENTTVKINEGIEEKWHIVK